MKNLQSFENFILEYDNRILRTSIDNPEGGVTNVLGEEDVDEYMFFQNLKTIQECVNSILSMDPKRVNAILRDGHAWAVDHVSTSKDDIEEVAGFLKGRVTGNLDESRTNDFQRVFSMSPEWWIAWKKENEAKGYDIKIDAFSKTYEVSKGKKLLFLFDYGRNKIFTNEDPEMFSLKTNITKKEFQEIENKADSLNKQPAKEDPEEKKKKEEEQKSKEDEQKGKDLLKGII